MFPAWLHALAWASLVAAGLCAAVIAVDEARRPPKMAVMAAVWPLCALFGGPIWLAFYRRAGRSDGGERAFPTAVSIGSSHCGAGCVLGDIVGESLALVAPGVAVAFGYPWLFHERMFALWGLDLLLAILFGVAFQYFALKPMSDDPPGRVLLRPLKADLLSILAWQLGMYAAMAALQFGVIGPLFGGMASPGSPEFWLMMQAAMLAGFATAWPMNAWLIKAGVKEAM